LNFRKVSELAFIKDRKNIIMLDKIRNSTDSKLAKVILGIIIIPFALFGIDSYLSSVGSNVFVAKVNGVEISGQQYQNTEALIKEQMGGAASDLNLS
jgi:peptidyl-prolyl cis-trans isomerase D